MHEVTRLRNKHLDYGEHEHDEEWYEEGDEQDGWEQWYRTETGHPDAAGVGAFYYCERVRGPQANTDSSLEPTD